MLHGNWRRTRNSTDTRQPVAQVLIKLQSDGKTSIEQKSSVRALSEWETEILLHRQHQRPCQSTFRTREEIKRREKKSSHDKEWEKSFTDSTDRWKILDYHISRYFCSVQFYLFYHTFHLSIFTDTLHK